MSSKAVAKSLQELDGFLKGQGVVLTPSPLQGKGLFNSLDDLLNSLGGSAYEEPTPVIKEAGVYVRGVGLVEEGETFSEFLRNLGTASIKDYIKAADIQYPAPVISEPEVVQEPQDVIKQAEPLEDITMSFKRPSSTEVKEAPGLFNSLDNLLNSLEAKPLDEEWQVGRKGGFLFIKTPDGATYSSDAGLSSDTVLNKIHAALVKGSFEVMQSSINVLYNNSRGNNSRLWVQRMWFHKENRGLIGKPSDGFYKVEAGKDWEDGEIAYDPLTDPVASMLAHEENLKVKLAIQGMKQARREELLRKFAGIPNKEGLVKAILAREEKLDKEHLQESRETRLGGIRKGVESLYTGRPSPKFDEFGLKALTEELVSSFKAGL